MKCPKCQAEIQGQPAPEGIDGTQRNVIDSRCTSDNMIRRRRRCLACGMRVTTYETIGRPQGDDVREALRQVMEYVKGLLDEGETPEAEGTDQPQRMQGSGQVGNAFSVGSSH